jgi:hypothetical protein
MVRHHRTSMTTRAPWGLRSLGRLRLSEGEDMKLDAIHGLFVGAVLGTAWHEGVPLLAVVDEDGDYTDTLALKLRDDLTLTIVVPPPPAGWRLEDWLADDPDIADQVRSTLIRRGLIPPDQVDQLGWGKW